MTRLLLLALLVAPLMAADRVIDLKMHRLRSGDRREWSEFPADSEGKRLDVRFTATANPREHTIRLRHRDVKQTWDVFINDKKLAPLPQDENVTVSYFAIAAKALRDGDNVLSIIAAASANPAASDDVEIGDVHLLDHPRADVLAESRITVQVIDKDTNRPVPGRITIADPAGALVTLGTTSGGHLAIRPGVVYTATGHADVQLPAGKYTLYATRGFEWGMDQAHVEVRPGETIDKTLSIRREVETHGYVASDTHCHTFTYSRHGDATTAERLITIAGEGIELPVATDHNLYVNYETAARDAGLRALFTPVVGNEVTTPSLGHFNVFPIPGGAKAMNFRAPNTELLFNSIDAAAPDAVIILNHARDVHGGFRPFDPEHHVSLTGRTVTTWQPRFNAMEVINSGATRTDAMGLVHDWLGLLNAGRGVAPIGASDSHDVSRYILGQGRTYVRCDDADPGNIDAAAACRSIRDGKVLVSYGLLADLRVNDKWTPGDCASIDENLTVSVRVLGPAWTTADHVTLYANGLPLREATIGKDGGDPTRAGPKFEVSWEFPRPRHDVHLVAVATGPGVIAPYWPCAKPYQPTSPDFTPYVLGVSGAVFVDADQSGAFTSARDYAKQIVDAAGARPDAVARLLQEYDESVAAQAAHTLRDRDATAFDEYVKGRMTSAPPHVRRAFAAVRSALEASVAR